MAEIKKTLDESGLLYFGKAYYQKLQGKFVALEEGKALSTNDFTTAEQQKLTGIEEGAEVNVLETVKVNGSALTANSDKAVDITIVEGTGNGTVKVNGTDVNVHGLGSAAYAATTDFDASGAAAAVLGTAQDASTANTVYGVKAALEEAIGDGGSVNSQITAAIGDLDATVSGSASGTPAANGTMVATAVEVVEADGVITGVNITSTEVEAAGAAAAAQSAAEAYARSLATNYDASGAAAAVLGTNADTASDMTVYGVKAALNAAIGNGGSVSTQITDAINGLDASDAAVANQFVTSVSEEDGVISVTRAQPTAANISVADLDNIAAGDLQTVLGALEDAIDAGGTGSVVTVEEVTTGLSAGVLKAYNIKQGNTTKGTINIPKDFLVKSGEVRAATASDTGFTVGEKILDFEVNTIGDDETSSHILISVADLVDAYTAGNGIDVSASNVISAVVDNTSESFLTVGANGLKLSGVQTAINAAQSAAESAATTAINALDADVDASGTAAHSGIFVVSGVTQANGLITGVDSVEVDPAGAAATAESNANTYTNSAIAGLDADVDATGTAQHNGTFVVSGITEDGGVITSVDSVEVEAAGAAAAALTSAQSYADGVAATAEQNAKTYADGLTTNLSVSAAVASGSANYVTASASGKTVTVGLTSDAIASLGKADSAIQSISDVDGTYVSLAITSDANDATAKIITVTDTAIGTALGGKVDKVANPVAGNIAVLDSNGNITDGGTAISALTVTYMTNQEIQTIVDNAFATS